MPSGSHFSSSWPFASGGLVFQSRWLFGFSVFCCFYLCQNLNNDCVLGGATCKRRPEQVACNAGFNAALKWQIGLEQRQGIS